MEPWEDEEEKAEWRRVLVPLGATEDQADVAWLGGGLGYKDSQVATFTGLSVPTVKTHVRILFALLKIKERDRHAMGRVARGLVDAQRRTPEPPGQEAAAPRQEPRPAGGRRAAASARRHRPRGEPGEHRA